MVYFLLVTMSSFLSACFSTLLKLLRNNFLSFSLVFNVTWILNDSLVKNNNTSFILYSAFNFCKSSQTFNLQTTKLFSHFKEIWSQILVYYHLILIIWCIEFSSGLLCHSYNWRRYDSKSEFMFFCKFFCWLLIIRY